MVSSFNFRQKTIFYPTLSCGFYGQSKVIHFYHAFKCIIKQVQQLMDFTNFDYTQLSNTGDPRIVQIRIVQPPIQCSMKIVLNMLNLRFSTIFVEIQGIIINFLRLNWAQSLVPDQCDFQIVRFCFPQNLYYLGIPLLRLL